MERQPRNRALGLLEYAPRMAEKGVAALVLLEPFLEAEAAGFDLGGDVFKLS
jgi:hypothetical protein